MDKETGIDGNCPDWPGASKIYSWAYAFMREHGASEFLIEALEKGDEETLKAIKLDIQTRKFYGL